MNRYKDLDKILGVLNTVAETYDKTSKIMTLCLEDRFRWEALASTKPGRILDVGSGSGSMVKHARRIYRDSYIVALEPLPGFLAILSKLQMDPRVDVVQGYIEYAPFRQRAFDTAIAGFMLRDVMSLSRAIAMMASISRRIVILDFWRPSSLPLLIIEIIYMLLIMLPIAAATPRQVKHYLSILGTVFRVPPLKMLIEILSIIGSPSIRCWALCIVFRIAVEVKSLRAIRRASSNHA